VKKRITVAVARVTNPRKLELFNVNAETLELENVNEIPQSNFIARKGIIVKEEYDDAGVSYREGVFADYYLQVGGDWDLGILNQLAMIVLAKKTRSRLVDVLCGQIRHSSRFRHHRPNGYRPAR
jgi:hypothetical protein